MDNYSVLMSVYYKENPEYLRLSIESMLRQTIKPEEFIIVKDGQLTKVLDEVINSYVKRYKELFTIIQLEKNGGLGRALNYGISASRNELIARMDSDDISLSNRCYQELKEFEKNEKLTIVGGQINEFIEMPDNIVGARKVPLEYDEIKTFAKRRSPFNHPTVMYKKSKVIECGGYSEYGRKEDLDLFIRMINEGYYAKNLDEVLLLYRTSKENLQRRKNWINCSEYIAVMYKFYKMKYIGTLDLCYVIFGQLVMFIMPEYIVNILSNRFLRNKVEIKKDN